MILLYAYIKKYKNYLNEEVTFDPSYSVSFINGVLKITYNGMSDAKSFLGNEKPDNLHILVGKTGSGKTNLLQLIGSKHETRYFRCWDGEEDAYFLLYKLSDTEFFLEICNVDMPQFSKPNRPFDKTMPKELLENAQRTDNIYTRRFIIDKKLNIGESVSDFSEVEEYGARPQVEKKVRDTAAIFSCYDNNSFITPPYPKEKETEDDFNHSWIGRMALPYQRTSIWYLCDYIREYSQRVEGGELKRQVSFVLSTHNFADNYPIKLPNAVEKDYFTYYQLKEDLLRSNFDSEIKESLKGMRRELAQLKKLSNKELFIHDLITDYAKYLRMWVAKIENYNAEEEIPEENPDFLEEYLEYKEFMNYYSDKNIKDDVDPTIVPDGLKLPVLKRLKWLAEYIDRAGDNNPHYLLWQIYKDIADIVKLLLKLDNKYFTIDSCKVPVADMVLPKYKDVFNDLFEIMDGYTPDDAGIFTDCLLPYTFTHLSTGEFQYAKVLGGIDQSLKMYRKGEKTDKIILLDEPEAYMHPELTRQFIKRLYNILGKHNITGTIQIIIGTHSPFLVSDVLAEDITRLTIDPKTGNAIVLKNSNKEYFSANLYTIFADGFFLDYTIGEYSRTFLQYHLDILKDLAQRDALDELDKSYLNELNRFVPNIGDDLIRRAFEILLMRLG